MTPQIQNTFENHLKSGAIGASQQHQMCGGSRRLTSSSFTMTVDEKVAAVNQNSQKKSKECLKELDSTSWPIINKQRTDKAPGLPSLTYSPFHLQESQETIITTLIHKNIQLKKTIQKLSTALKQIQGLDSQNGQVVLPVSAAFDSKSAASAALTMVMPQMADG